MDKLKEQETRHEFSLLPVLCRSIQLKSQRLQNQLQSALYAILGIDLELPL